MTNKKQSLADLVEAGIREIFDGLADRIDTSGMTEAEVAGIPQMLFLGSEFLVRKWLDYVEGKR